MEQEPTWRPNTPAFDQENQHAFAVVHFWAEWNGYDLRMAKCLKNIGELFDERLPLFSCDIDREASWALASEARVTNVPALALVVGGVITELLTGLRPEEVLHETITEWRERACSG